MLYEVITEDAAEHPGHEQHRDEHRDQRDGHRQDGEADLGGTAKRRITSYNVCYTKLLRLREKLEELPKDKLIVPFCKLSLRGYEAQRILAAAGFLV